MIGGGLLGPRSGQRPQAARHGRDRRASDAVADGAPARPDGGQSAAEVAGGEGPRVPAGGEDRGAGRRRERVGSPRCSSPAARRCRPISSSWRSASVPTSSSRRKPGLHCDRGIVVNDTLQTFDPRIYAVGECVSHRGVDLRPRRAAVRDGEGLRQSSGAARHRPLRRLADVDQAQGHRHRPLLGRRLHRRRRHRGDRAVRSGERRLQEARAEGRQADRQRALRRHRRRHLVFQAAARGPQRRRHPRPADVRRVEPRRHGPPGAESRGDAAAGRAPRSAAATACARARSSTAIKDRGTVHAGRRAQAHQGVVVVRLVHRTRRADPDGDGRRRLLGDAEAEADVRLHRPHAPGSARRDPRSTG